MSADVGCNDGRRCRRWIFLESGQNALRVANETRGSNPWQTAELYKFIGDGDGFSHQAA